MDNKIKEKKENGWMDDLTAVLPHVMFVNCPETQQGDFFSLQQL